MSGSAFALLGVSVIGIVLTLGLSSGQAQNAVIIGTCGALAAIVVKGLDRADATINAALQLAEELARQSRPCAGLPPEDGDGQAVGDDECKVVPLPSQRSERPERSEAS